MHDIAEFLGAHDPFSGLDEAELEELASATKVEYHPAGATILRQGEEPQEQIRVIRRGSVELLDAGRVLDVLGEGEPFGHPSMLSGLPARFEARAAEDTLCYVLPSDAVLPLLARPASLPYLARSLLARPAPARADEIGAAADAVASQSIAALIRRDALSCSPDDSLRDVARRMASDGRDAAIVKLGDGGLGIVTDSDFRKKVVAEGLPVDAPVSQAMSAPVVTAREEDSGADAMLAMLNHDIHHLPVLSARGELVGVISDADLVAAERRTPLVLRRAIAGAADSAELRDTASGLRATVIALHRAQLDPSQTSAVISVVADALIRRMIELAVAAEGPPPSEFAWMALGSHGRREPVPSSDVDSGTVWRDPPEPTRPYVQRVASEVEDGLKLVGWQLDPHGVTASGTFSANSIGEWRAAIDRWREHPDDEKVLIATSILLDGRTIYGPEEGLDVKAAFFERTPGPTLLRWLLRLALVSKPPTGFRGNIVVEHSGEHGGTFDIKHGGLLPIVDIARYASFRAGARLTSTVERLRAAGDGGTLSEGQARTLEEAHELFTSLRLDHQVQQLEDGVDPNDFIDPKALSPLTRRYLRGAFREVASVQKSLSGKLTWE